MPRFDYEDHLLINTLRSHKLTFKLHIQSNSFNPKRYRLPYAANLHHTRSTESAHRKTVRFHTSLQLDAAFTNSPVIIRHYCNGTAQLEQSTALAPAKTYAIVKVGRQIDGNEAVFLF